MDPNHIKKTKLGIYCPAGDFYVDPIGGVEKALITHAHGDHAYRGSKSYYCSQKSEILLKHRLGIENQFYSYRYGEKFKLKDAWVSFHPAGHILGSSQIRIEVQGHVTVISGDYKRGFDPTCDPFEVVRCDDFVTESTFALPIYRWEENFPEKVYQWWERNKKEGKASLLFAYPLGKSQHILAQLKIPCLVHGSIVAYNKMYEKMGIDLGKWKTVPEVKDASQYKDYVVIAPPLALGSLWIKKFLPCATAFVSGWMAVRGVRKRRGVDTGFVLSDHADWSELIQTIKDVQAKHVWVTHGSEAILARYLNENSDIKAHPFHLIEPEVIED